jgi:hypothetical protein
MHVRTTIARGPARPVSDWWRRTSVQVTAILLLIIGVITVVLGYFIDEPMRQRMEATLNQRLKGYSVRLPELDFHPIGLSLTLRGLTIRQNAHPEPPVMIIETLDAGVHWRALLHLRLVADFALDGPRLHINRPQLLTEAADPTPVKEKGWQQALEAIYPLKINQFRVSNGALTYVDDDPKHPLELSRIGLLATNIRNVRVPDRTYPSPISVEATVFERGALHVAGHANFLAEPFAGVRTHVELTNVPLQRLKPVAAHANVQMKGGTLTQVLGDIEYAPKVQNAHFQKLIIDAINVDYTHGGPQNAPETQAAKEVAEKTVEQPVLEVQVDEFTVRKSTLGYVETAAKPGYRLYLDSTTLEVRDVSNRSDAGPAQVKLRGEFMSSGTTRLDATVLPRPQDPQLDMALQIESTDMTKMNDVFRTYGDFDVASGTFSLYNELHLKNGQVDGYIKPLFTDIHVYDHRQDKDKPLLHKLYEIIVGGVGKVLENSSDSVATEARVKGSLKDPKLSTWEVFLNLLKNAFVKAIVPGLERAVGVHSENKEHAPSEG